MFNISGYMSGPSGQPYGGGVPPGYTGQHQYEAAAYHQAVQQQQKQHWQVQQQQPQQPNGI